MDAIPSEYQERLKVELRVIQQQGFAAYFLVMVEAAFVHDDDSESMFTAVQRQYVVMLACIAVGRSILPV